MRTIAAFLLLGFLWTMSFGERPARGEAAFGEEKKRRAKKPRGKFTIGKETTYVDGPFDKDGYIDYAAALNQRLGRGVTPANNANVLLWKAFGPHPGSESIPAEFFKLQGIEAPPEVGEYFISLHKFKVGADKAGDEVYDLLDDLMQRPWTAKEQPQMAAWLKANQVPLDLVVEATKRSHYFSPLVPPKSKKESSGLIGLNGVLLPGVLNSREFAYALVVRAMLRASQRQHEDAWQDLLACHRLGRLIGRGGTLIEGLVGIAIDNIASGADLAFLGRAGLNARRIESCLGDLQKLPPLPVMADQVDLGERFVFLDIVTQIDRHGPQYLDVLFFGSTKKFLADGGDKLDPLADLVLRDIDWDPALKNANRWYNRLAAAMRDKDRAARQRKLSDIETELKTLKQKLIDVQEIEELFQGGKGSVKKMRKTVGQAIGNVLITLLIPAVRKVQDAADRTLQVQVNVTLAYALASYQRDHGHYPKKLDALAPNYLKQIPQDLFAARPLVYRPAGKGYLLYSVGINGKDEEGRGYGDTPPGDDLNVRMPLPQLRRK